MRPWTVMGNPMSIPPFVVPVSEGTSVISDDIATVVALPGKIGVFWGNQLTDKFYLAVHRDGASATDRAAWTLEVAAKGSQMADDHFMLTLPDEAFAAMMGTEHYIVDPLPVDGPELFTALFTPAH